MNKQLLSELQNDFKKLYYIVNRCFSVKELMGENHNKGIYCPFHGESRASGSKPSARFYDNEAVIKLWCFQEHKSYYAYHYISKIMKHNPLQYLISHTTEKKILYYLKEYELEVDEDAEPNYNIDSIADIDNLYSVLPIDKDYSTWYIV